MRGGALRFPANRVLSKSGPAGCGIDTSDRINGGLIGCWLFNEGSGSALFDIVSGNHGIGTALTFNQGAFGLAGKFNGSTSKSVISSVPVMANPWTISGWVNWTALTNLAAAFGFGDGTNGVYLASTTTNLKIGSNGETPGAGATALSTGKWYHVVMFWDGTKINAFLNGAFEYSVTPSGSNWKNSTQTVFGKSNITAGAFFTGGVDLVRVHNRALMRGEIARLYGDPFAGILMPGRRLGRAGVASAGGRTGTIAVTEANDVLAASGSVQTVGSIATTEAADVLAAAGKVFISGTAPLVEAGDILAASGTVSQPARTGTIAAVESDDTLAASGSTGAVDRGGIPLTPGQIKRLRRQAEEARRKREARWDEGLLASKELLEQISDALDPKKATPAIAIFDDDEEEIEMLLMAA